MNEGDNPVWEDLLTLDDFEDAAKKVLPKMAYDYFRSGADEERTLRANRKAFRKYEIWHRVLVDVSAVDLRTRVLGTEVSMPVLVSPTAYQKMAHAEGEAAASRGAAEAGTIFTLSTLATSSIEEVAAASSGPKWFQLYVHKDRGITKSLLDRAESAGYNAVAVTVDAPILGRRLADERNRFVLPEGLSMVNIAEFAEDLTTSAGGSALTAYAASRHDASFSWNDVEWLRSLTNLPVLIKGLVRGDDAARAAEIGVAGVVVSNHGGRQLDGAPAAIDAVSEVADAAGDRCEVLMDGGIRRGTDVLKALALGARAVMVGRPVVWGLALGGAEGVRRVLEVLREELARAMALAGCPSAEAVDRDLLRRRT
ncbi:MAG: alpha-hydroxy acid oxidase [Actinomycetota bacterium]